MLASVTAIQQALREDGLDGWLWYDFRGSNSIARDLAGTSGVHATRRWFYLIPASGEPRRLVHRIERFVLGQLPGQELVYSGRADLDRCLSELLTGIRRLAMEYSPDCGIPSLSCVDAGTIEQVRAVGAEVVSSGDLVQRFLAVWDGEARGNHLAASERLYEVKDRAFALAAARLEAGDAPEEFEIQQSMLGWMRDLGLVSDAPPLVAAQEHAGNPHYSPDRDSSRALGDGELLLLDLWGRLDQDGAVYADITWVGASGQVDPEMVRAFELVVAARDAAVESVERAVGAGEPIRGFEVDRAARGVIDRAGLGHQFIHRTGHSLGREVHGPGVNMDDYETHDTRRLLSGTGFTIEPGIYTPRFGVRSEINAVVSGTNVAVSGPRQMALVALPVRLRER